MRRKYFSNFKRITFEIHKTSSPGKSSITYCFPLTIINKYK